MSEPGFRHTLTLFDDELDEACYRARLAAALLGVPVRLHAVDVLPGHEECTPAFRALSPAGRLPALVGLDRVRSGLPAICGASAVLRTLALLSPSPMWRPKEVEQEAAVAHWLDFAGQDLHAARVLRRLALFEGVMPGEEDSTRWLRPTLTALRIMEDHMTLRRLAGQDWFAAPFPTLADIALFPSFALSRDAGISHDPYPALRRWMRAFKALPGFIGMPGIPDYG